MPVSAGIWGAAGIMLSVDETGNVKIDYACAFGEIEKQLMIDGKGNFRVEGTHTTLRPGPIRIDDQPTSQPAIYEGKISAKSMTFKATLKESGEVIAEYVLEKDKRARIHRCL